MNKRQVLDALTDTQRYLAKNNPLAFNAFLLEIEDCQYDDDNTQDAWIWFLNGWRENRRHLISGKKE